MTEKGFEFKLCSNGYNYLYKNNELYITEKGDYVLLEQKGDVVELLNELAEEKKELQVQCNLLREQANEFHRGARENANRVGQMEKENKELKQFKEKVFEIIDGHIVEERRFPREITPSEKRAIVLERRIGKVELLETLKKEISE